MPFEDTFFQDVMYDFQRNLKEELSCEEFKKLSFQAGFKYYEDVKHNIKVFVDEKKKKNTDCSEKLAKKLVNTILECIPEVDSITENKLRSPLIFDNLENVVMDLLQNYYTNIQGSMKCKFFIILLN